MILQDCSSAVYMLVELIRHIVVQTDNLSLQAKEYFEKAADDEEPGEEASGHYNLGVMYLKGIGVKRDVKLACKKFIKVANAGHPKAFYQLAKMFHTGIGLKKNLPMVI